MKKRKPFYFQKFKIEQTPDVFAVGTDGVLLGALCRCENASSILEIGTGTGLISLMMAQRNITAKIHAVDIDPRAVDLAQLNFKNSPFTDRLTVTQGDINALTLHEKKACIVCNPPFFEVNDSEKHTLARQQVTLTYPQLIHFAQNHLTETGLLSVIIPHQDTEKFITTCTEKALYLIRNIHIFGIRGGKEIRNIVEFSKKPRAPLHQDFVIEEMPRQYSAQYLESTKAFHQFRGE